MGDAVVDPPVGGTSIRFGSAIMQPLEEKDHFGLYRPVVIVRNEDGKVTRETLEKPAGPLAVYRMKRNGDVVPESHGSLPGMIRSSDHKTGAPIEMILVWHPAMGEM